MIYICAGLPKSASTICFRYLESMIQLHHPVMNYGFVHQFGILTSIRIFFTHLFKKNVILKTHTGPVFFIRLLVKLNIAKVVFTYRDPRDLILSSIDYKPDNPAQKIYYKYTSIENTIGDVQLECGKYSQWKTFSKVLLLDYDKLVINAKETLELMGNYFNLKLQPEDINSIILTFQNDPIEYLNTGKTNRYKSEMTKEQIAFCNDVLGKIIVEMGYEK